MSDSASISRIERLSQALIDAAVAWAVKIDYNQPAPETQRAFEQWLHADPLHALAWERVHSLKGLDKTRGAIPPKLALDTLQAVNAKRQARGPGRRKAMKLLSLAGITVAAAWLARDNTPWQRLLADISTAVGEQKTVRLSDGSVIVLNTDSAISTDLTGDRRIVVLRRGEIMVTTGPDVQSAIARPFWVSTPVGSLRALGTRFVVRLDRERARISVQEGAVELHPANGAASTIVHAGESLWLTADGTLPVEDLGFEDDAWADGIVAGRNIRLADLVSELARYRRGHIACDERVADLRVSGVFHVKNTDQALQFLAQTQPIAVTYRTRFWVMVGPKGAG